MRGAAYLRLARIQTASLTGLAPVMGAVSSGNASVASLTLAFISGVAAHAFGFALNEYWDRDVDRLAADLSDKPLVSGDLDDSSALRFACACVVISLVAGFGAVGDSGGRAILVLAIALAALYNRFSKRWPFVDWAVAGAMGGLVIFGGEMVGGLSPLGWTITVLLVLQLLLQNTLAHLKDLRQDAASGARNAALFLGVHEDAQGIHVSRRFRAYVGAVRLLHLGISGAGLVLLPLASRPWAGIALLATQLGALRAFTRLLWEPPENRTRFLELFLRHEAPTLLTVTILLLAHTGWLGILPFVALPVIWGAASLRILHSGRMPTL